MKRTATSVKRLKAMFETTYGGWRRGSLTQEQAAEMLGVCPRTFQRYAARREEEGQDFVLDRRVERAYERGAPLDEVLRLRDDYRDGHQGWNVRHYYSHYRRKGGQRSYNWVRQKLQQVDEVKKGRPRGKHRMRRERKPIPGMMLHQDGSTHEWLPGQMLDLIATLDDATGEHYSLFLCKQEGTWSSLRGVREVLEAKGLFCSLYTDRGSHYWHTPKAGGKVNKKNPTQFGRAMAELGIGMIPAYSPEARGRSERVFRTHQDRLVKELVAVGAADMAAANRYIQEVYLPRYNEEFACAPKEEGSAFLPLLDTALDNILCEKHERQVRGDNCVEFGGLLLQIPANRHRMNYVRATIRVFKHEGGQLSVYHGPLLLARYGPNGRLLQGQERSKAVA